MEPENARAIDHPSAWLGPEMAQRDDWLVQLNEQDVAELESALAAVRSAGLSIPAVQAKHVNVPRIKAKKEATRRELDDGRGFALIRGLPGQRYSKADAAMIYWIVGTQMGLACAQNAHGEMLGHVRDLGANYQSDNRARGYQTNMHLPFHTDSTDAVALLCLQKSMTGGASRIVSSTTLHNEMARRRPDLWAAMHEPMAHDRRGEENPGDRPWFLSPCFIPFNGKLFIKYIRPYVNAAQRFLDAPRLTPAQVEAMDMMDSLCNDPAFYMDMQFEPGDMQFLSNYTVLHARTAYEDWPESERKRHLLRLWLRTNAESDIPPAYAARNADMVAWQRNPRAPVFDISEIAAELAT